MKHITFFIAVLIIAYTAHSQVNLPQVDTQNKRLIFTSTDHLERFIDFYTTNDSEDALDQIVASLENKGFESLLNVENRIAYLQSKGIAISGEDLEDDELIGDDRLACLLNNERQIVIGGKLLQYEEDGLYYTRNLQSNIHQKISAKKNLSKSSSSLPKEMINGNTVYNLGDDLRYFSYDYKNSIDVNDDYNVPDGSQRSSANDPYAPPYNLKYCNFDDAGFFESLLPGSSEVCINYINDDKRIRTKFSNQNYLIFSTVYAKVKSQKKKKFLGITTWKRDNFCKYLEMGRTVVIKYPVEYPFPPVFNNSFLIKDNGYNRVIDINGNTTYSGIQGLHNVFDKFPFDDASFNYEIYFYVGTYDPTPKDINKLVAKGVEGLVKSLGKSFNDLFGKDKNTSVGITIDTPDGFYMTEYGVKERKYGTSRLSKSYDSNAEITLSASAENFFESLLKNISPDDFLNGKSYEVTVLDVYGFGSYNGYIYGSRIVKGHLNENNTVEIDSDGDGVPDHEDFCRYQKGLKRYSGCPYALIDNQSLYANRINDHNGVTSKSSSSSSTHTLGACYNLQLKSADYPSIVNTIKGGIYQNYDILAGKEISIDGRSNITIKPQGNTKSITLKIESNPCNILQPRSRSSAPENVQGKSFDAQDNPESNSIEESSFSFYPNPISNVLYLEDKTGIANWSIKNNMGQEMLSENSLQKTTIEIDTSTLNVGMYFLHLTTSDGRELRKTILKE
ncbi:T9SS type A sorting domain-containing protein [Aquimarina sp. 2201CG1-2-11]|uniref:T9SS type A sorting domain-containing protein n=1 Tax=Aquimarina discodermiae TaxID=3231043 RepID=UPI003462E171